MDIQPANQSQLIQECVRDLRSIIQAFEDYSRNIEKKFGLTGPQLWALWELGRSGPLALKDLATRMHLDPSTVVGIVDRLALKGLVVRHPDTADRRRISLVLTPQGSELLQAAPHPAQGHLLVGLERMDHQQLINLRETLRILGAALGAEPSTKPSALTGGPEPDPTFTRLHP
jgi:DNA-binding MarR family transcriptional regulator